MQRPPFENIKSGAEFNTWYWLKEEMIAICKQSNLPINGRKFELRDRIMFALDNEGKVKPKQKKRKSVSKFDWAKSELSLETEITDNISFGPNFRRFMQVHIGKKFTCHSDFMDWTKASTGKTLKEAVEKWIELENRKKNPEFKREIASNNMFNQYTRDFLNDNKGLTIEDAKKYWLLKKQLPTKNGFVKYERTDLKLYEY